MCFTVIFAEVPFNDQWKNMDWHEAVPFMTWLCFCGFNCTNLSWAKCNGNQFASLALAIHLMLSYFFFFIELDSEFRQDIFSQDDYHYLNVPVVGSFTVDNAFDCTLKCLRNPCCFSVNLAAYRGANGKIWCELLSSEKHSNPEKYKRNQTSHHLSTILEV